ncbi:MAG: hypothetical protein WCC65_04945 [Pseudonocardiaceae bacterium]
MAVTPPAVPAVRSVFKVWSAIFDGRRIVLRESGVFIDGTSAPICSADDWKRIGGYFTDSAGWLTPATIREHLTELITDEGRAANVDEVCALVDLGLELSEPALRIWHREGFALPTDTRRRKQLTSKMTSQREKLVRRIGRAFPVRPPAATPGPYRYPPGSPHHKYRQLQLRTLLDTVRRYPLSASLVRQASAVRECRAAWRDDLPPDLPGKDLLSVMNEGSLIAVRDRLIFYVHVLYGASRSDRGDFGLTRFDWQAAAKPEHEQMLRVGGRILKMWSDACPQSVQTGPDVEHQILDAVMAMRRGRLHGTAAADEIRNCERKAQVLVDLAVADVVGTALDSRPNGAASRWLAAGCLDAIVAQVQAQATHERVLGDAGALVGRRDVDVELDEKLTEAIPLIVNRDFFDEYGELPTVGEKRS